MIIVRCPACRHEYQTSPAIAGMNFKCKQENCGHTFQVTQETIKPASELEPANSAQDSSRVSGSNHSGHSEASRYQNLKRYLHWAKQLAFVQLILFYIAAVFLWAYPIFSGEEAGVSFIAVLTAISGSVLTACIGYIVYVITLAGIEFVHVIVDIESNTRHANNLREEANMQTS